MDRRRLDHETAARLDQAVRVHAAYFEAMTPDERAVASGARRSWKRHPALQPLVPLWRLARARRALRG